MSSSLSPQARWTYAVIIGGLVVWALIHAVGASLNGRNPWAGALVLASFVFFLSVWIALMAQRKRRLAREDRLGRTKTKSGGHVE